jgi:hypothetical protein
MDSQAGSAHLAACLVHMVAMVNDTLIIVMMVMMVVMLIVPVTVLVMVAVLMFVLVCVALLSQLRLLRLTCCLAGCALLLQLLLGGWLQPGLVDLHL